MVTNHFVSVDDRRPGARAKRCVALPWVRWSGGCLPRLPGRRRRFRGRVAGVGIVLVTLALVATGCSGNKPRGSAPAPSAAGQRLPGAVQPATRQMGKTVWFGGFKLTFGTATVQPSAGGIGGDLTIDTTFENQGSQVAPFVGTLALSAGGRAYDKALSGEDVPEVPGKGTAPGKLAFTVDDAFSLDRAVLTIGSEEVAQAVVPLGGEGQLVALQPAALKAAGTATGGTLKVTFQGDEVRADVPEKHQQVRKGHRLLTLHYSVSYLGSDSPYGGYAFSPNNIRLELPDGSAAEDQARSLIEVLHHGTTRRDNEARFEIDEASAGAYKFVVEDNFGAKRGQTGSVGLRVS